MHGVELTARSARPPGTGDLEAEAGVLRCRVCAEAEFNLRSARALGCTDATFMDVPLVMYRRIALSASGVSAAVAIATACADARDTSAAKAA